MSPTGGSALDDWNVSAGVLLLFGWAVDVGTAPESHATIDGAMIKVANKGERFITVPLELWFLSSTLGNFDRAVIPGCHAAYRP
jgi:hypothetical protein